MEKLDRQWIIEDGNLPDVVVSFIRNQKGKYRLSFCEYKAQRSNQQNKYYHAYLKIIEMETGQDNKNNELHEYFKRIFLEPEKIVVFGKELKIPASTSSLSKVGFSEYIRKIELETGVTAPNPEDLYL